VTEAYPFPSLHPHIRRIVEAFGPRRVFWGTDLTRLPCSYRQAVTLFADELDFLAAADKEWIMGRGIAEWLNWPLAKARYRSPDPLLAEGGREAQRREQNSNAHLGGAVGLQDRPFRRKFVEPQSIWNVLTCPLSCRLWRPLANS
jgi:hypothetical protein